jgi:hypothetical protein
LETKFKELNDLALFEKKLLEQEIESLKAQLTFANETINSLGMFFKRK